MLKRVHNTYKLSKDERPLAKIWEDNRHIGWIMLRNDNLGKQKNKKPNTNLAVKQLIDENEFQCPFCEKILSCKQSTIRHVKYSCPIRKLDKLEEARQSRIKSNPDDYSDEIILQDGEYIKNCFPDVHLRDITYISGAQGSGKSTYCRNYIDDFMEIFCDGNRKNNPYEKKLPNGQEYADKEVFLFSKIENDDAFEDLVNSEKMTVVDIADEDLIDDPIDGKKETPNSLVVFDDYFSMKKDIANSIHTTLVELLQNGRDQSKNGGDIYTLVTSHVLLNYHKTRDVLNECSSIVIYPKAGQSYHIKRCLKIYCGYDKHTIKKIMELDSRWVAIHKRFPNYVVYETGAFIVY